jgi:hypothetical protein
MRVKAGPLRAHLQCERPLRVRTNEERREEEPVCHKGQRGSSG